MSIQVISINKKKVISNCILLLSIFMMVFSRQVWCEEINDFQYIINDNEVKIVEYSGNESNIVIPEFIEGKPVVAISEDAFCYENFDDKSYIIDNIYIHKTVNSVNSYAFNYYFIKNINVDSDNKFYCSEDGVLYNKDQSILIRYPTFRYEFKISDKVIEIQEAACKHCKIISANLPKKLEKIGVGAFSTCTKLSKINIPDSVTYIGDNAFNFVYTDEFHIPKEIEYLGDTSTDESIIFHEYNKAVKDYAIREEILYIPFTKKAIGIFIVGIIVTIIIVKKILYIKKNKK